MSTGEGSVEEIVRDLAAVALDGDGDAKRARTAINVPASILESYCGVYDVGSGKQVAFRLVDGSSTAEPTGQKPMPIFAESETKFYFTTLALDVEFVRDERGRVTHLMMKRDGRVRKAPRVGD